MPQNDDAAFRRWYAAQAQAQGLAPDPDAPDQFYDYRAAFRANAQPDASGHWPSEFKRAGHPNMVVGGFNVQTGERVAGTAQGGEAELVRLGWDPAAAKRMSQPQGALGEQQFNQIVERVIASAPAGLSEAQLDALIDQEIAGASPMASHAPTQEQDFSQFGPGRFAHEAAASPSRPDDLPMAGGIVGGALGGIPGAAVGGAAGALGRDLIRANRGDPETPRTARGAAENVGLNAAGQAALTGAGNVVGAGVARAGRMVTNRAVPMVRSALKPVWAGVRRQAGIEGTMPAAVANKQAQFIVDRQLRTPEQADALVKSLGGQIDEQVSTAEQANPELALDTAGRIPRYLNVVLRRIEQQMLPRADRRAVQNVGRKLVKDSPLSRSTYEAPPTETLEAGVARGLEEGATRARNAGKPPLEGPGPSQFTDAGGAFPRSSRPRELRTDVKPSEGVRTVRTKSFFDKDATGGTVAGGKAIERAVRDGIKTAVPSTRPLLKAQGRAMDARTLLDRSTWRDANRDQVGMGGMLGLAGGRPILSLILQGIKEGQLGLGLAAGRHGPRMTGQSAGPTAESLLRLLMSSHEPQE